jgi:hypothetical protein
MTIILFQYLNGSHNVKYLILSGTGEHYRDALYAYLNQLRKSANKFIQIKQEYNSKLIGGNNE